MSSVFFVLKFQGTASYIYYGLQDCSEIKFTLTEHDDDGMSTHIKVQECESVNTLKIWAMLKISSLLHS